MRIHISMRILYNSVILILSCCVHGQDYIVKPVGDNGIFISGNDVNVVIDNRLRFELISMVDSACKLYYSYPGGKNPGVHMRIIQSGVIKQSIKEYGY